MTADVRVFVTEVNPPNHEETAPPPFAASPSLATEGYSGGPSAIYLTSGIVT